MPKQVLAILEAYAGRTKAPADCVLQAVNPDQFEPGPFEKGRVFVCVPYACSFPCGMLVAGDIVRHPGIEFKPVKADAPHTNRDFGEKRADLGTKAVAVHAEIAGRIAQTDDPRLERRSCARCLVPLCDGAGSA